MGQLHLAKFAFGTNIHQDVSSEELEYYQSFFSNYFKEKLDKVKESSLSRKTIPISYKKLNSSNILKIELNYFLKEEGLLDSQFSLIPNKDLIVVDIKYSFRNTTMLFLFSWIDEILNNSSPVNKTRFVIIIEDINSNIDVLSILNPHFVDGKILLIDKKKRFKDSADHVSFNKTFSFDSFTKNALKRTKFKLIRKIGHFIKHKNNDEKEEILECNKFFYDGNDCVNDIQDLLLHKILDFSQKKFNVDRIIYDSVTSPWLDDSILLLDSELQELKNDYDLKYKDFTKTDAMEEDFTSSDNILLVFDFINTGKVLREKLSLVKKKFPKANIKILAIIVVDNNAYLEVDSAEKLALIKLSEDENLEFDYFLEVKQTRYEKLGDSCPMCKRLELNKYDDTSFINDDVLSSFEAWTMCDEADYMPETFSVEREKPYVQEIPLKPDTRKLIENNSAYLAIKYSTAIKNNSKLNSADLVIIFPDETSNKNAQKRAGNEIKLEETASGYFAETLHQLKEIEYLGIPRKILDKISISKNETPNLTFIKEEYPVFYDRLRLLPGEIVIMDEFGYSGGTLNKILSVLEYVEKKPLAYFPIFNFGPKNKEHSTNVPFLNLYEFNIHVTI
ncbi:hypothetical protein [Maribacter sp. 2308TA10-17]|uniref:hypothetical protein n=1 Tax=Maribacter sp. 2308TA10-17 TaxID=3386276 RepID=UPI0039BD8D96